MFIDRNNDHIPISIHADGLIESMVHGLSLPTLIFFLSFFPKEKVNKKEHETVFSRFFINSTCFDVYLYFPHCKPHELLGQSGVSKIEFCFFQQLVMRENLVMGEKNLSNSTVIGHLLFLMKFRLCYS